MVHKRDSRCSRVKDTIARFEKLIEKKIVSPLNISIYILLNPSDDKKMLSIKRDTVTTTRGFQKVDLKKNYTQMLKIWADKVLKMKHYFWLHSVLQH